MSLSNTVPPSGRKWIPYLKRAEELDNQYPLVSFYCRLYVAESLMAARQQQQQGNGYDKALDGTLVALLDVCENEKAQLGDELDDGPRKLEDFCISVFGHADNEDRSGQITAATSMKFYCASLFFDVLEGVQVDNKGTLSPDLEDKRKYAKYKAVYINKCLKEGTTPEPGPPGNPAPTQAGITDKGSFNYAASLNSSNITTTAAAASPTFGGQNVDIKKVGMNNNTAVVAGRKRPTAIQMQEAKKKCHHASSAIDFDDRATAIQLLTEAIALLQGEGGGGA
ncbi:Vacuolar protein sorting-associated protein vta1 [Perkinsus chesapeaki]|uniref:Vacuolar protein sorting-associated protein vta1 n=1 Tax=Perkinsus chesapeaki TaxID=330153 RepID=A0A7J6LVR6_PERCH|nr:Vacuolar protein sorting-associated protein vta1 [Perkinsus chesapeaki]